MKVRTTEPAVDAQRRQLLTATIAGLLLAATPYSHAREAAVQNPVADGGMSALAAAAAIAGIVSAVAGLASAVDSSKQLGAISAKLDQIISMQKVILQELRAMRAYFDEALLRQWEEITSTVIAVNHRVFAARVESPLNEQLGGELALIAYNVEVNAYTLAEKFGVAAFVSYASAVSLDLMLFRKLRKSAADVKSLARQFAVAMESRWLARGNPDSVYALIGTIEGTLARLVAEHNARPRRQIHHERWRDAGPGCRVYGVLWFRIEGDIDAGFTAIAEPVDGKVECSDGDPPCRGRSCRGGDFIGGHAAQVVVSEELPRLELPAVPPYTPSGNHILDQFNHDRTEILSWRRSLRAAEYLKAAMERMHDSLLNGVA